MSENELSDIQITQENNNLIEGSEEYELIANRNTLLIKHSNLLISHKTKILNSILYYIYFIIFLVITILYVLFWNCPTFANILSFIRDCPYFLVFITALLLIPVWCLTSLVKGIYKISNNEESNLLEKMVNLSDKNIQ